VISKPEQLKQREPNRKRTLADMVAEAINRIELQQEQHQAVIDQCLEHSQLFILNNAPTPPVPPPLPAATSLSTSTIGGGSSSWNRPPALYGSTGGTATSTSSSGTADDDDVMQQLASASMSHIPSTTTTSSSSSTTTTTTTTSSSSSSSSSSSNPSVFGEALPHTDDQSLLLGNNFDSALRRFLLVYNTLSQEEKPAKIRKLIRSTTTKDTERCSQFIDLFSPEGLQRAAQRSTKSRSSCACTVCPYQKELERIDDFYEGFLGAPLGGVAIPAHPSASSSSSST
jgi:hypothetical protein